MDELTLTGIKLMFVFALTLHNLEEAAWLPQWSQHADRFHKPVQRDPFVFAVIVVTTLGYLLTALDMLWGSRSSLIAYAYMGFVGMMGLNAIFPHALATLALRKYCPGLLTGLCLNLPFALIILIASVRNGASPIMVILSVLLMSGMVLFSLNYLFRLGARLIDF